VIFAVTLFLFAAIIVFLFVPTVHATTYSIKCTGSSGSSFYIWDETSQESISGPSGVVQVVSIGDTVEIRATPPSGCTFSEWQVSGAEESYSNPQYFTWDTAASVTFNAVFNCAITVNSAYGSPFNPNPVVSQGGSDTPYVSSSYSIGPGEQAVCTGWTSTSMGSGSGTSAALTDITTAQTVTFNWQIQYYLTVSSPYDTPSGSGWYNSGSYATASVGNPSDSTGSGSQVAFNTWSYDGSSNYASDSVYMNGPITDTASWTQQYYLTVNSAYGTTSGSNWYNAGTVAYAGVSAADFSGGSGTQYAFTGWSSGENYYASDAITMNGPYTDTANFVTQFYLTVTGGDGAATGQGWYNTGSDATASSNYVWSLAAGQSRSRDCVKTMLFFKE
jgi:hypothetical protein